MRIRSEKARDMNAKRGLRFRFQSKESLIFYRGSECRVQVELDLS